MFNHESLLAEFLFIYRHSLRNVSLFIIDSNLSSFYWYDELLMTFTNSDKENRKVMMRL